MDVLRVTDETDRDELEAMTRRCMAAVTQARGWDGERQRRADIERIDSLLDEWLALASTSHQ